MLRSVVASSLKFRLIVLGVTAALMVLGIRTANRVPMDVFPEFAPPLVEIQTEAPGLSTEEVDALVTVPLENALNGSAWVKTIRSKSVLGLSSVVMIFEDGVDLLEARQLVQERLAMAARTLPRVVKPPVMLSPLSALSRCMKVGISSKKLSMLELSELVRWTIRPRIMAVPGVANVAVWGERPRQLQVLVDPNRLREEGVTLDEVVAATRSASEIGAGGFVDTPNQRLAIVADTGVQSAKELARTAVPRVGGATRTLGDIAEVVEGHPPLIGEGVVADKPGILLIVEKQPWANTLEVTRRAEEVLERLAPGLEGVTVDGSIFRPATFVEMSIDNLNKALKYGIILVAVVLIAFLFDWRTAVISMTALPVSLLVAIIVLERMGGTLNTMVLAGLIIALGEVVDDAIIDVENISRRLRMARESGRPFNAFRVVLNASLEVRSAVVYGSLIVILVVLPVYFLEGLAGSFFSPLATAYILAILASLLTALTLTPAMSLMLLTRGREKTGTPVLVRGLLLLYRPLLRASLRLPVASLIVLVLTVGGTALMVPRLGEDFLPRFKEYDFLMHWVEKPGTSVEAMTRITERAGRELLDIPGVRAHGAHIGRAEVADEVVGPNFTELWISIDPSADYDATISKVQEVVDGYPGLYRDLLTYLKERIKEVLTGTSASIVVRIFGPELDVLRHEARMIGDRLKAVEGLVDLKVEPQVLVPQIRITLKPGALKEFGLDPGWVRKSLSTLVRGQTVGEVFEGQRVHEVVVWGQPHVRADCAALRSMLIDLPSGGHVPIGDVASIRIEPTPNVIRREGTSRRIDVTANVRGRDLASAAKDVEREVTQHKFPRGYHPEVLGEYAAQRDARNRLLGLAVLAVVGVFLLLQTDFRSLRASMMILLGLPFALAGGVWSVFGTGGILSLGSFIGFVTVLGIAARNSIMLLSHYRHLELEENLPFGTDLVIRGAEERLAPILMTALTTALALAPILVSGDLPGHEIEHPLAVVIVGGLVTSCVLCLFVLPSAYLLMGRGAARRAESEDDPEVTMPWSGSSPSSRAEDTP